MEPDLVRLLDEHERVFNEAVTSGDFGPLVQLFAPDAVLRFEGVPVGPFLGRDAIAEAYAAQPPTATMTVLSREALPDGTVLERVAWGDDSAPAGELVIRTVDGRIAELTVRFP